ncbi:MAG: hypothetical protein FWG10_03410 [Eubacteriaceae bacterium]|nr:hypothetical protein [Eubacteriaceae bacterium]
MKPESQGKPAGTVKKIWWIAACIAARSCRFVDSYFQFGIAMLLPHTPTNYAQLVSLHSGEIDYTHDVGRYCCSPGDRMVGLGISASIYNKKEGAGPYGSELLIQYVSAGDICSFLITGAHAAIHPLLPVSAKYSSSTASSWI